MAINIEPDLNDLLDMEYFFGNYIYNVIQPEVTGNIEIFKYVLGKICLEYMLN